MERPDQAERKVSFNPEAATFSPTTIAAKQAEETSTATGSAERGSSGLRASRLPGRMLNDSCPWNPANQNTEYSPKRTSKKKRQSNLESPISASGALYLEDLMAKGIPKEALMRTLGGE